MHLIPFAVMLTYISAEHRILSNGIGGSPVEDFLDSLSSKQAQKVAWVLRLIEAIDSVPAQYLKKLPGTGYLGSQGAVGKPYDPFARISIWLALSCLDQWICKEDREGSTARDCIGRATTARLSQQEQESMSELERYVNRRKRCDPKFAEGFEVGYSNFKVGVLLRQAREKAGMTQADVARRLRTKKSAISRIENHAEDIRLSTIQKYAKALGKNLRVEIMG